MKKILILLLFLCLSSCVFPSRSPPPSFLILAVDSLGFDSVSCHRDKQLVQKSGWDQFCQGSIRFHHAHTPSVLAQPALASLLTGLYPYEHGVWSNGSHFLSSEFKTVPEEARKKKYRSAFFSGGGAIWRKSGLNQGFEVFDDNVQLSWRKIYRSADENINLFLKWVDQFSSTQAFFSVLYFPDLQFPKERREEAFSTLDHEIYRLIQELKKRKRWHSTYVILLGTKGGEKNQSFRQKELGPWSLFSDNTRISLFIKGLHKLRKKSLYGNVNIPVTLADIGSTLLDLLEENKNKLPQKKLFPIISLKPYLINRELTQIEDAPNQLQDEMDILSVKTSFTKKELEKLVATRPLLLESGWPLWRKMKQSRFAIRKNNYLFIHDKQPQLYNSLTDRRELNPFLASGSHANIQAIKDNFLYYFKQLGIEPWQHPSLLFVEKLRIASHLFSLSPFQSTTEAQDQLRLLIKKDPKDLDLISWRAELALKNKQWRVLKNLGEKTSNFYWQFLAFSRMGEKINIKPKSACEKLFAGEPATDCKDKSLLSLYNWIQTAETGNKNKSKQFFYFYLKARKNQKILHLNWRNYLMWDTHYSAHQGPLLSDLFLHLPENKNFLKLIKDKRF